MYPLTRKHITKFAVGSTQAIQKIVVCSAYAPDSTSGTKTARETSLSFGGDAKKTWHDMDIGMKGGLVVAGTSSIIAATIAVRCIFINVCICVRESSCV